MIVPINFNKAAGLRKVNDDKKMVNVEPCL